MKKILVLFLATTCTMQLLAQGTFNISPGTIIKTNINTYVVFNDVNLVNNGSLQALASTVKFAGTSDESISGSGTTTIDSLKIAKGSTANLNLQANLNIGTSINFVSGLINLGDNVIDLGIGGMLLNESEASRAYTTGSGYIQSTQTLNAPSSANPGNLGAIITSAANMGSTVVRRSDTAVAGIPSSSILRNFTITPTNDAGLNATYRFQYLNAELNGQDASMLDLWKSTGSGTWVDSGATTRNPINKYVEKTGINDFSTWTLAIHNTVLPVTLSSFNAHKSVNDIEVVWQVQASINVSRYEVERSNDGKSFSSIGSLSTTTSSNYSYIDFQPAAGANYYRLRIVGTDGSVQYSSIVEMNSSDKNNSISFFPNPVVDNTVSLQMNNLAQGTYQLSIFDNEGKQVYQTPIIHDGGSSVRLVNLPAKLSSGVYRVEVKNNSVQFNSSLFIK